VLPASAARKQIEVWFQDEARVGQKESLEYIWARLAKGSVRRSRMEWQGEGPIGSRPPMVRDVRHDSVHLFGAICPARAGGAAIIMPAVNSEAMNEHLAEISTQVAPHAHALLVCDGAGWHQPGSRLVVPNNITLLSLPPYAPELNPMENVWDYLRGNKLSSLVWNSYEATVEGCRQAWLFLANDPARIISIGTRSWARVNA
jgi:putative transposase